MIRVQVAGMILDAQTQGPILLLHVPSLDRFLPIWIGPHEAAAIGMALRGERFERPLTHDLICTIVDGLAGRVTRVVIHDLRGSTFLAKIFIEREAEVIAIDARPSDAIAIAVRTAAPVFVAETVVSDGDRLLALDPATVRRLLAANLPPAPAADPEAGSPPEEGDA
ncbi:MAG: bifunctional nuclease family protein [Candidatus Krumholzibacteriia bacterium]